MSTPHKMEETLEKICLLESVFFFLEFMNNSIASEDKNMVQMPNYKQFLLGKEKKKKKLSRGPRL